MYRTSIPLISPHPHEVDRSMLEEHPLVRLVDTKWVTKAALWYDNITYNVMIYFVVHFILIIIPNIDCMHLMSLQHNDEPKDNAPQPPPDRKSVV